MSGVPLAQRSPPLTIRAATKQPIAAIAKPPPAIAAEPSWRLNSSAATASTTALQATAYKRNDTAEMMALDGL